MKTYQQLVRERQRKAAAREPDPIKVRLTTGVDYAHEGHRLDLADERLISRSEPRWIDGRRYMWRDGMWCLSPDLRRRSSPAREPAPRIVEAIRGSEDAVLEAALSAILADGGQPTELTVRIVEPRSAS